MATSFCRKLRGRRIAFALAVCAAASPAAHAINIVLNPVGGAGSFTEPLYVTHAGDGSGRRFVMQHAGRIRIIDSGGTLLGTDFLNIGVGGLAICTNASGGDERGCLGLAFHPNYAVNGKFYVSYTRVTGGASMISEFTNSPPSSNVANAASRRDIWGPLTQPQANHNGGWIGFGPDGFLYMGMGDGGGADDDDAGHNALIGNGQDTTTMLGKILRIDVDGDDYPPLNNGKDYAIPATNPFFGSVVNAPEIFAWGMRNPWRLSFDRGVTGRIMCGDVGQNAREEIDVVTLGANYGWRITEGTICHNPLVGCSMVGLTAPIFDYAHASGRCSITGGYVYRGTTYAGMYGLYFYADYCTGELWTLTETSPGVWGSNTLRRDNPFNVTSFGEDQGGELYVTSFGTGTVYQLTDTDPPPSPSPSATASRTPSMSASPTASATASRTPSPSASPTTSMTPSRTPSPSASLTASFSPSPSPTASPSLTASLTPSLTASSSPSASPSPSLSASLTASASPTTSPSDTPTQSPTPTATSTETPTATPSLTATPIATATPTGTPTALPSPTPNAAGAWEIYE